MDHAVVQRWLKQILSPYGQADRVYSDVDKTLLSLPSLSPKTEVYTYDDGRTQLLLVLTGTVPMQYKGATYNIPIAAWIPRNYPREAPIVYVTPTSDMLVRRGRFVDPNGRVEGDYLQRWQRKWEGCNLLELLHDCQAIFGQEPPVYAKPKNTTTPVSSTSTHAVPRQATTATAQSSISPTTAGTNGQGGRERGPAPLPTNQTQTLSPSPDGRVPLRPPKPGQTKQYDDRRSSNGSSYAPIDRLHDGRSAAPQRPAYDDRYTSEPANNLTGVQRYAGSPVNDPRSALPHEHRHMSWNGPPRTPHYTPSSASTMLPGPLRSTSLSSANSHEAASNAAPPLPPMPSHPAQRGYVQSPQQQQPQLSPMASVVPAPPRPPNPELLHSHALLHAKLQHRLQYIQTSAEESNAQLNLLSEDLDRGDLAIKDEMARLEAVRDVCKVTGDELQGAVDMASQRLDELRKKEEPDFDGLLSATSLVGNQLLDLVAEDNAVEDTLYHLGRALNAEMIDLDRFLKQTRFLAREQFMRRALAMKICRGMGWDS